MISCKRASELISKQMDEPLSLQEAVSLKMHLFLCEFCEQFRKQLELISKGTQRLFCLGSEEEEQDPNAPCLSPEAKQAIIEKISKSDS